MGLLTLMRDAGPLCFDEAEARAAGAALAARYRAASPFPHIIIDHFFDAVLLRSFAGGFPPRDGKGFFDRDQERLKYQFQPQEIADDRLRELVLALNSSPILAFLEALTGIPALLPDPDFLGGGLHETLRGGHLSVHADFNIHPTMRAERRLNLLLYLNEDWSPGYGGDLELWDREMTRAEVKIAPLMGRAVIFSTGAESFHGHPDPLACPPDRSRRSIATYYYTALADDAAPRERTTIFRPRPASADKPDRRVALDHFIREHLPAWFQPLARRLNRFR